MKVEIRMSTKNILIIGVPRSDKSILVRRIIKEMNRYNLISSDSMGMACSKIRKELGIELNQKIYKKQLLYYYKDLLKYEKKFKLCN